MANFKLHGSALWYDAFVHRFFQSVGKTAGSVSICLCPPFPYLGGLGKLLADKERVQSGPKQEGQNQSQLSLGAQDASFALEGPYTGEVSALMLKDMGCRYVLLGHSERRQGYGETDGLIRNKRDRVFEAGLSPILCVGEPAAARQQGQAQAFVEQQLALLLDQRPAHHPPLLIAYEPVWSIGTGQLPSSEEIEEMHAWIELCGKRAGLENLSVLYGGSVTPTNAPTLAQIPGVGGFLVGRAALQAEQLAHIVGAAGRVF
jgi:triosephosphate isomerase